MFNINIDGLRDDESWLQLTALLLDSAVSDQFLETMRARLVARLRYVRDPFISHDEDELDTHR